MASLPENYKTLGIVQLVFGCVCFVLDIIAIVLYGASFFHGIWGGIFVSQVSAQLVQ